jgi:hypothetical protein
MAWIGNGGFLEKRKSVPFRPVFARTQAKFKRRLRVAKINI